MARSKPLRAPGAKARKTRVHEVEIELTGRQTNKRLRRWKEGLEKVNDKGTKGETGGNVNNV